MYRFRFYTISPSPSKIILLLCLVFGWFHGKLVAHQRSRWRIPKFSVKIKGENGSMVAHRKESTEREEEEGE